MKKSLFSVFGAVLIVIAVISCDKTGSLLPNNSLDNLANVTGNVSGQSLTGHLIASTSAQNTVTLLMKSDTTKTDNATYAVVFQREAGTGKNVKFDLEKAQIIMTPAVLYVNSVNSDEKYIFKIRTDEADNTLKLIPDNYKKDALTHEGYGLSYRWGTAPFNIDEYITILGGSARAALKTCGAGGKGSSSCSVQGKQPCSVSCQAGYYACCNNSLTLQPDCSCVPNGQ